MEIYLIHVKIVVDIIVLLINVYLKLSAKSNVPVYVCDPETS